MRENELWQRLGRHLGSAYARVWAQMQVLSALDNMTVRQALDHGVDCKSIWRACWLELELPFKER